MIPALNGYEYFRASYPCLVNYSSPFMVLSASYGSAAFSSGLRHQALSIRRSITGAQYAALSIQRSAFRIHY